MSISDFAINLDTGEPEKKEENKTEWKEPEKAPPLKIEEPQAKPALIVSDSPPLINTGQATPVASQDPEEILNNILGKIGDKIGASSNLKIIIYGDPGSMKSSYVATAPNNLIVDLEDGLMSAKISPHGVADNVRPYPWDGFENFAKLIGALKMAPPQLDWVEVVSIDTFSELHKRGLAEITEREWRKRPSTNRYVPESDHHQENNERMLRVIRALKEMKRDLIITTHATTVEPKGKPSKTYPDFSEKLANKIEAMMDVVGYCEKKVIDNKLCMVMKVREDSGVHTKTRLNLPAEMINPTFADIKKVWEESKEL